MCKWIECVFVMISNVKFLVSLLKNCLVICSLRSKMCVCVEDKGVGGGPWNGIVGSNVSVCEGR